MDKQLDKAIMNFYSDLRDKSTEEVYAEYLNQCEIDGVKPRCKQVIVREACQLTGCVIEQVRTKYFRARKED